MNMDIKTKIEDFFINIALGPVLAKRERVFGNREKEMNRCIKAFFSAIKGGDTDRIKALFAQNAINELYKIQKEQILLKSEHCHKCVYENTCSRNDIDGNCKEYKRDPPDGGYYG